MSAASQPITISARLAVSFVSPRQLDADSAFHLGRKIQHALPTLVSTRRNRYLLKDGTYLGFWDETVKVHYQIAPSVRIAMLTT